MFFCADRRRRPSGDPQIAAALENLPERLERLADELTGTDAEAVERLRRDVETLCIALRRRIAFDPIEEETDR